MAKVKLLDFAEHLKKGEMYYFWAKEDEVRIYSSGERDNKNLVEIMLDISIEEWQEFLKAHNCDLERGDYKNYMGARCRDRRNFHCEMQDGLIFEISHGGFVHGEQQPDIIRLV